MEGLIGRDTEADSPGGFVIDSAIFFIHKMNPFAFASLLFVFERSSFSSFDLLATFDCNGVFQRVGKALLGMRLSGELSAG